MTFSATVFQNEFLVEGATEVNAVVTVTSAGGGAVAAPAAPEKAVVLIVDTSGSMESPSSKIRAARKAAATACQMLPDGTWFALVAGFDGAECVYPTTGALVRADAQTRNQAAQVATHLTAGGHHRDHRVDLGGALDEELVLEHRGGERHGDPFWGSAACGWRSITTTVMLSWPPCSLAKSTRRRATSRGSPSSPTAAASSSGAAA